MKKFTEKPDKDDKDEQEKEPGEDRFAIGRSPFLPWVPLKNCTTVTRGLYHNGTSLHTCTAAGCCKLR
jgi:hypothetical protein